MSPKSKLRLVAVLSLLVIFIASVATHFQNCDKDRRLREMQQRIEQLEKSIDVAQERIDAAKEAAKFEKQRATQTQPEAESNPFDGFFLDPPPRDPPAPHE